MKPKAAIIPSTLSSQAPIQSYKLVPQSVMDTSPTISTTGPGTLEPQQLEGKSVHLPILEPILSNFIKNLQNLVKDLPESIPEASEFDRLAVFGVSPMEYDDLALDAAELWETRLNNVLKSTLGWGTEGNMDEIIRHGKWGLDGLVNFATYFVEERGVSGDLFEGKLSNLVMALKEK